MLWPEFNRWGVINRSPWNDMRQLQREVERLFSGVSVPYAHDFPAVNLWYREDHAVLTTEIPGVDPQSIDITVKDNTVTLSGTRTAAELKEGESYHRQERAHGKFSRTVRVPFQLDSNKVQAQYDKGILKIELPRAEADKPKKIQIQVH